MQKQLKKDKILTLLTTFETSLSIEQHHQKEKSSTLQLTLTKASQQRQSTTAKMVGELEKKLFESERERLVLKRERDQLERQARVTEQEKERGAVSASLVTMVRDNQTRIEDSNKAMMSMIQRQDKEMRDKEDAWAASLLQLKEFLATVR